MLLGSFSRLGATVARKREVRRGIAKGQRGPSKSLPVTTMGILVLRVGREIDQEGGLEIISRELKYYTLHLSG